MLAKFEWESLTPGSAMLVLRMRFDLDGRPASTEVARAQYIEAFSCWAITTGYHRGHFADLTISRFTSRARAIEAAERWATDHAAELVELSAPRERAMRQRTFIACMTGSAPVGLALRNFAGAIPNQSDAGE